ncbi:hypothetical protein Agub_g6820, partial [Astrephomene gubernaculifera]
HAAARGGHVGLMEWLLQRRPVGGPHFAAGSLLEAAVHGCPLACVLRLYRDCLGGQQRRLAQLGPDVKGCIMAAAAGSRTPDWQAKVEWLEARGFPKPVDACIGAAKQPDALDRLTWLRRRGYPLCRDVVLQAAERGNCDVLSNLMALCQMTRGEPAAKAAAGGQLAALQLLHDHGRPMDVETVKAAASAGHLHVVVWLVETLGEALQLNPVVFNAAACSGNLALLRWLHEHGCPWGPGAICAAVSSGCEELLEWLLKLGQQEGVPFPLPHLGRLYMAPALSHDLATLRWLQQAGCGWDSARYTFTDYLDWCLEVPTASAVPVLSWLLEAGCPVDWREAKAKAAQMEKAAQQCTRGAAGMGGRKVRKWLNERAAAAAVAAAVTAAAGEGAGL